MKNTARKIMAVMVCLTMILTLQPLAAPPTWASEGWTTVGNAGFSAGEVFHTDLVLDNSGTPYVTYEDNANGNKATVMKYNGHTWVPVGSPGFSAGVVRYTDLALDESGTPYLAYQDGGNSNKATVMKYNGSAWVPVGSPGFSAGETGDTSITLDESGTPYLAYSDCGNSYKATVMKYNGSNWETVGSAGFSAGQAYYTSLTLDESGTPYLAYSDGGNSNKATVMKYNGSNWETVGGAGFSANEADYTSLALDESGTPYVAYRDKGNSEKATVMKYNGSAWVTVGSAGFSAGQADYTSLALDESGTPYVAYRDGGNSNKATVMKYNGNAWVPVGSPGFSAGEVLFVSLVTDGSGTPYLAYKDGGNGNKATLMKHDTTAPVLTAGGVSRSSDSEATVNFTSDEAGQYYYGVVAEGAAVPAIDTSGPGTACGTSEETITLTSLTAGGRDIYIKVKDAAGNVSGVLKITIPSLLAGTPALTAAAGDARVDLNWTPVAGSVSYSVYQSTTPGFYGSALASVASSVYSYNAAGLTNCTPYYFKVKAVDFYGNSSSSNEVNATPRPSHTVSLAAEPPAGGFVSGGGSYCEGDPVTVTASVYTGYRFVNWTKNHTQLSANSSYSFTMGTSDISLVARFSKNHSSDDGYNGSTNSPQPVNSSTGSATLSPSAGGTVSLANDVSLKIPAGALQGSAGAEVNIKKMDTDPPAPAGFMILGTVYDFTVNHQEYYSFNRPVTLTFIFDPSKLVPGEIPAIYYYDETRGQWVNIGGSVSGNTITVNVDHFTKYAVMAKQKASPVQTPALMLTDLEGHWARASINELAGMGAISGYTDGTFKPDKTISRAEFATVLVKAFELEQKSGHLFKDTSGHWAADFINTAAANGIATGYDAGTFGPDQPITREQMAVMIVKAAKLAEATGATAFKDNDKISSWAQGRVQAAVNARIIKGYPDNTFRPQGHATRAEAVSLILNSMK
ncbi:MAG: S-layer homology domain-containing protein [Syntrophomonas sp.]